MPRSEGAHAPHQPGVLTRAVFVQSLKGKQNMRKRAQGLVEYAVIAAAIAAVAIIVAGVFTTVLTGLGDDFSNAVG